MQSPYQSKQLTSGIDFYTTMSGENVTQLFAQISAPRNFPLYWTFVSEPRLPGNKTLKQKVTVGFDDGNM